jgi:hypothetical protein
METTHRSATNVAEHLANVMLKTPVDTAEIRREIVLAQTKALGDYVCTTSTLTAATPALGA